MWSFVADSKVKMPRLVIVSTFHLGFGADQTSNSPLYFALEMPMNSDPLI